jgi:dTDP-glucose pyrophosphorylase
MIKYCNLNSKLIDVVNLLEESGFDGMVTVLDDHDKISFIVTDGDIRRALVAGISTNDKIKELIKLKNHDFVYSKSNHKETIDILFDKNKKIRQIPIINNDFTKIKEIIHREKKEKRKIIKAAIMAGGQGTRLRPYTIETPKPLLPVKGKPIISHIISWFEKHGVHDFYISVNYLKEKIINYYKKNNRIKFLVEKEITGTAGSLKLIEDFEVFDDLVLINGDILCDFDLTQALAFHSHHNARVTMVVKKYSHQIPFGVIQTEGLSFKKMEEKPNINRFINTGIYILKRDCLNAIDREFFNATDLVDSIHKQFPDQVIIYPINEDWIDLGTVEQYEKAK